MRNSALFASAVGLVAFVLGFAYGNLFNDLYGFHFRDWQTLGSTIVAIIAAAIAYFGVWNTQRITVLIKEEDRIDELIPGLRQVEEGLLLSRSVLSSLGAQRRHQAKVCLDSAFKARQGESIEDVVDRKFPLADDHLKREVARIVFALKTQAEILSVGREEVERYERDVANIQTFDPSARQGLLEVSQRVRQSHERENQTMGEAIRALDIFCDAVKRRIAKAEARKELIRSVIDKYFHQRS